MAVCFAVTSNSSYFPGLWNKALPPSGLPMSFVEVFWTPTTKNSCPLDINRSLLDTKNLVGKGGQFLNSQAIILVFGEWETTILSCSSLQSQKCGSRNSSKLIYLYQFQTSLHSSQNAFRYCKIPEYWK